MSDWHHSPVHRFVPGQAYMVTGATLYKRHYFTSAEQLQLLQDTLFAILKKGGWDLNAWAIFSNHYHFVAQAAINAAKLKLVIQQLHSIASRAVNRMDGAVGRQVLYQYWDTCLTFEKSYLARLNYVNNNPVHHGLVSVATQYPYCSATWFEQHVSAGFRRKVQSFRYDRLRVPDNF